MPAYSDILKNKKLQIFLDISTFCNAGCPQCHRVDNKNGGLGKIDWLPLVQWSIDEFKAAYPPHIINVVHTWEICGTWGDPFMAKDIAKIIQYIYECKADSNIRVDTNGSLRSVIWWKELGLMAKKSVGRHPLRISFAIEGVNQEMQNMYRRKTILSKILANMQALAEAGGKAVEIDHKTVIHKHNQDHLDDIALLSEEYGATTHSYIESNRFENGTEYPFIDEHGKPAVLEQASNYKMPTIGDRGVRGVTGGDWKIRDRFAKLRQEISEIDASAE
jgi:MoaA/NifB/PqqE/SkfB family radical SAM enzyme